MGKKRRASGSLGISSAVGGKPGVATTSPHEILIATASLEEDTAAKNGGGNENRQKKRRKKNVVPATGLLGNNESYRLAETATNEPHGEHTTTTTESEEAILRLSASAEDRTQSLSENTNHPTSKTSGQRSSSDSSTFPLAKLPLNLEYLHKKYSFGLIEISTKSRYNTLVKSVIKLLSPPSEPNHPDAPATKPRIVLLESKAECAPRLIAIVEAVKVHIAAAGENWFQYNGLRGEILPFKPRSKTRRKGAEITIDIEGKDRNATAAAKVTGPVKNEAAEDDMDLDEEDAFQTMVRGGEDDLSATNSLHGKDKVRSVPIMTILIARVLVPELAGFYW